MKIYDYHTNPEKLLGYENRHSKLPYILDEIRNVNYWGHDADIKKANLKKLEPVIATDPEASYMYAFRVLNSRFKLGEKSFIKKPRYAYAYLEDVVGDRDTSIEKIILTDPVTSCEYARFFLDHRWLEAEPIIAKDLSAAKQYNKAFGTNL